MAVGNSKTLRQYNTPSLHAEMDAYYKLPSYYKSKKLDLIVLRFGSDKKLCSSRPCYNCLKSLYSHGLKIENVYYSNNDEILKEKFSYMIHSKLTQVSYGMKHKK